MFGFRNNPFDLRVALFGVCLKRVVHARVQVEIKEENEGPGEEAGRVRGNAKKRESIGVLDCRQSEPQLIPRR